MASTRKSLATRITLESLFSIMNFEMSIQTVSSRKVLATPITFERFFSIMNFEMSFQAAFSGKSLATTITLESFFFGMISCIAFRTDFFLGNKAGFVTFNHLQQTVNGWTKFAFVSLDACYGRFKNTNHATFHILIMYLKIYPYEIPMLWS